MINIIFVDGLQVPADSVVNGMLCVISYHPRSQLGLIYHIGSSMRNPLKIGELIRIMFRYFSDKPFVGSGGEGIKVKQLIVPATMASFYKHMDIHYNVPMQVGL
jgi:fatty acyl-CoA reductase